MGNIRQNDMEPVHREYRPGYNPKFAAAAWAKQKEQRIEAARAAAAEAIAASRAEEDKAEVIEPKVRHRFKLTAEAQKQAEEAEARRQAYTRDWLLIDAAGNSTNSTTLVPGRDYPAYEQIINLVISLTGVSKMEIFSPRRDRKSVFARHMVMYLACRDTPLSLPEVGRRCGDRDHTTALHARRTFKAKADGAGFDIPETNWWKREVGQAG